MKKLYSRILTTAIALALASLAVSFILGTDKPRKPLADGSYVIGFYNLENLFDTIHDKNRSDNDFLPDGKYEWTEERYHQKLHNMATAIRAMADENGMYHAILGVAEVENKRALDDLLSQPELKDSGYEGILEEGGDNRGIDVGLIYRPDVFKVKEIKSIPYTYENEKISTRDVLLVRGLLAGEPLAVFVAHLPSRRNDRPASYRNRGAQLLYAEAMKVQKKYPGIKIVIMGDMNDDPIDESMVNYLNAKETLAETGENDFFSPFISMLKAGYGSMEYRGRWQIFDQILVNDALANAQEGSLRIQPAEAGKYYGKIFKRDFLTQQEGRYAGTPYRTFSGDRFINGYSDHYPTFIIVSK